MDYANVLAMGHWQNPVNENQNVLSQKKKKFKCCLNQMKIQYI